MEIGRLDRRVRFERRASGQDPDYGTPVDTWEEVATVMANFQEQLPSRGERVAEGLRIAERPTRVRCRYRADVDASMRVVDLSRGGRVLKIATPPIEIGGRRRFLEFMATEFSTSGGGS